MLQNNPHNGFPVVTHCANYMLDRMANPPAPDVRMRNFTSYGSTNESKTHPQTVAEGPGQLIGIVMRKHLHTLLSPKYHHRLISSSTRPEPKYSHEHNGSV